MNLIKVTRKTRAEEAVKAQDGSIAYQGNLYKKSIVGVPVKTLHAYRESYYGEVKDCRACELRR